MSSFQWGLISTVYFYFLLYVCKCFVPMYLCGLCMPSICGGQQTGVTMRVIGTDCKLSWRTASAQLVLSSYPSPKFCACVRACKCLYLLSHLTVHPSTYPSIYFFIEKDLSYLRLALNILWNWWSWSSDSLASTSQMLKYRHSPPHQVLLTL